MTYSAKYNIYPGQPNLFLQGHYRAWLTKLLSLSVPNQFVHPANPEAADGYPGYVWLEQHPSGWVPPDKGKFPTYAHFFDKRPIKPGEKVAGPVTSKVKKPKKPEEEPKEPRQSHNIQLGPGEVLGWAPQFGPQTEFFKAKEFEVFFGGSNGGGKTDAAIHLPLKWREHAGFRAVIIRKTFPELQEIIDRSMQVYRHFGATWNETKKRWTFPSGAVVEMGYFEIWKHHVRYHGQQYNLIIWDELGTCPEEKFWTFLMSRCRSADPNLPKIMRATGNPGGAGHAWVRERLISSTKNGTEVYVDPASKLERRFIPSRLYDNPALMDADPGYRSRLEALPDVMRAQLLDGDWGASSGMALAELDRHVHIIEPHSLASPWVFWGAMDWGYNHPATFMLLAAGQDGQVRLVDSLSMWRKLPHEIAERIDSLLLRCETDFCEGWPIEMRTLVAGRDCWAKREAYGDGDMPTVADQFTAMGFPLTQAAQSRVPGLANIRRYLTAIGPAGIVVEPKFRIFDTPANLRVFKTLQNMVLDHRDMDDVLKIDADEYGNGGDDDYDCLRYGLAYRPLFPMSRRGKAKEDPNFDAGFSKMVKRHAMASQRIRGGSGRGGRSRPSDFDKALKEGKLW